MTADQIIHGADPKRAGLTLCGWRVETAKTMRLTLVAVPVARADEVTCSRCLSTLGRAPRRRNAHAGVVDALRVYRSAALRGVDTNTLDEAHEAVALAVSALRRTK